MAFVKVARLLAGLLLIVSMLGASAGYAQAPTGSEILSQEKPVIEELSRQVDALAARLDEASDSDAKLVDLRLELEQIVPKLLEAGVTFRPRLQNINARLEQIGPPPAEGEPPEPQALTEERQALQKEKAEINTVLGLAEETSLKANRLIDQIGQLRRDLFTRTLSKRYDVRSALDAQALVDFRSEVADLYGRVSSWLKFVMRFELRAMVLATFFALLAAAALRLGGQRVFGRLIFADALVEDPSYISRLSVAFWSTLLPSAALAVFLSATYFLYSYYGVLRPDIAAIAVTLFSVIAIVFLVFRLSRAAFSPLPNWRLVPVTDRGARTLFWLTFMMAVFTGADHVLNRVSIVLGSPLSLTIAKNLIATVLVGVLVIAVGLARPLADSEGRPRAWPVLIRWGVTILGMFTVAAALFGFIGLARFISQQIVFTGATLATMYIGYLSARELSDLGAFRGTVLGSGISKWLGVDEKMADQIGLAISILVNLLVLLVGVPIILLQWGFQWGDITAWSYSVASEIRIGSVSFSLIGILTGILVFMIGYVLTRWFQSWLDGSVMTRGRVDTGVRNSIRTGVGYAGIAIAALVGISAAGIDLSSLALVAGALSLGIGFGLQNIVSNFVSGLILLVERPFKAGDWIVAGSTTGTVKKISVRATEIETFQRQTVILPNSELINSAVGNWTHRNKLGRVEIKIGVAYGSDVKKVHRLLSEIASNHPMVLKNPAPFVLFAEFGASSLDFEIRVFLSDILDMLTVQNDIRFAIVETFKREGIEIPFPQRDLHIRSGLEDIASRAPRVIEEEPVEAEEAGEVETPATGRGRRGRRRRPDPDAPA